MSDKLKDLYVQQLGRACRAIDGKDRAVIIDLNEEAQRLRDEKVEHEMLNEGARLRRFWTLPDLNEEAERLRDERVERSWMPQPGETLVMSGCAEEENNGGFLVVEGPEECITFDIAERSQQQVRNFTAAHDRKRADCAMGRGLDNWAKVYGIGRKFDETDEKLRERVVYAIEDEIINGTGDMKPEGFLQLDDKRLDDYYNTEPAEPKSQTLKPSFGAEPKPGYVIIDGVPIRDNSAPVVTVGGKVMKPINPADMMINEDDGMVKWSEIIVNDDGSLEYDMTTTRSGTIVNDDGTLEHIGNEPFTPVERWKLSDMEDETFEYTGSEDPDAICMGKRFALVDMDSGTYEYTGDTTFHGSISINPGESLSVTPHGYRKLDSTGRLIQPIAHRSRMQPIRVGEHVHSGKVRAVNVEVTVDYGPRDGWWSKISK